MKILLVTEYFYPQSSGGTELYVYNLAKALQNKLYQVEVLSVSNSKQIQSNYNGLTVHYIPFNNNFSTHVITGEKPADNLDYFINTVQAINPTIVHFHTLTTSISAFHVEAIKQHGFKTALTSHIAAATCLRGTLMQNGTKVCDGKIEKQKCLCCYLQNKSVPKPLHQLASAIIRSVGFPETLTKVVDRKQNELLKLKLNLDKLIVVSNWQKAVFKQNNFEEIKTALCRQAIETRKVVTVKKNQTKLVIGFLGRISAIKGLHILLKALKNISNENFELKIAAIPVLEESVYYQQQKQQVENMTDATWIENLPNEKVSSFLAELDVLCVPSQCLETGPFVVYEALSQSVPVLGSNLGGIKELITEGKNGWLFPHQNTNYLSKLIASFILQKTNGNILSDVEPLIRPTEVLANEMLIIYQDILTENERSTSN